MSTQLNYAFITPPNPYFIVAGQTAELEFTVSNSGNPVTLYSLAFTFPYGSAGSDLCASGGVSAPNLPGPGWAAVTDESGNFILTPPKGSISVVDDFTFTLSIQVNSHSGLINLNPPDQPVQSFIIIESTDAGKANWSPLVPLSKFPAAFQFSDLVANPPIAEQGEPIELSWNGTAGAIYTVDWPKREATYSDIQPGQPPVTNLSDTSFPPPGSGQTLAPGASQTVVFSVTAEYSSGGQTLQTGPLSVSVGVNLNAPTIKNFTATWQGPVLELNWATENATSVEIPSITPNTLNPYSGENPLLFTPSSTQPLPSSITLIAINQSSQTASTLVQGSFSQAAGSPFGVGNSPESVAVSPDGTRVFVANNGDNTLAVFDVQTLQPITGSPFGVGNGPTSVILYSARVFVTNNDDNTLSVLDAQTLQPITGSPFGVGYGPRSVAASPAGHRIFVTNFDDNTLSVLDAQTLQLITGSPVSVGSMPNSVAVSPQGARVFVANADDGTLTVLDAGTLQPITGSPFPGYAYSVAVSPDGKRVYVANFNANTLTVLDAGTLQPITGSPFPVGNGPASVILSPDSARVFVTNFEDNTLAVLDAQTLQPIAGSPFSVGNSPMSVAMSRVDARVFVANSVANTLTVFTPTYVPADGG